MAVLPKDTIIIQAAADLGYFGGGNRNHKSLDAHQLLGDLGKPPAGINTKDQLEKALKGTVYEGAFICVGDNKKLYVLQCSFEKGGKGQEESIIEGLVDAGVTGKEHYGEWNRILGERCRKICNSIENTLKKRGGVTDIPGIMRQVEYDISRLQTKEYAHSVDAGRLHGLIGEDGIKELEKSYHQFQVPGMDSVYVHSSFGPQCNPDFTKHSFEAFYDDKSAIDHKTAAARVKLAQENLLKEAKKFRNVTVYPTYISSEIFAPIGSGRDMHVTAVKSAVDGVNTQMASAGIKVQNVSRIQDVVKGLTKKTPDSSRKKLDFSDFYQAHQGLYGSYPSFATALGEIKKGHKDTNSHWIWYIFPQLEFGSTPISKHFSIKDLEEAQAYLRDPILSQNLLKITDELEKQLKSYTINHIFDGDVEKVKSSLTLFSLAAERLPDVEKVVFKGFLDKSQIVLDKIGRCNKTLKTLGLKDVRRVRFLDDAVSRTGEFSEYLVVNGASLQSAGADNIGIPAKKLLAGFDKGHEQIVVQADSGNHSQLWGNNRAVVSRKHLQDLQKTAKVMVHPNLGVEQYQLLTHSQSVLIFKQHI